MQIAQIDKSCEIRYATTNPLVKVVSLFSEVVTAKTHKNH
jgi:hypothetical protein